MKWWVSPRALWEHQGQGRECARWILRKELGEGTGGTGRAEPLWTAQSVKGLNVKGIGDKRESWAGESGTRKEP